MQTFTKTFGDREKRLNAENKLSKKLKSDSQNQILKLCFCEIEYFD